MLGIAIVTMNRSEFVIRQLYYYASIGCPYTIYIGDSSESEHINRTKSAIEKLDGQLKIVYRLYPGKNLATSFKELFEDITEKYAAFSGDDDFLIPNSLGKCVAFLETHPEYATAHGKGIVFSLDEKGPYGKVTSLGSYLLKENECETSTQRLFQYANEGWNSEFSVHRTEEYLQACEGTDILSDGGLCETIHNSISLIQGKSKQLDNLYLIRQVHPERYPLQGMLERLISPNWYPSYQIFHQQVAKALATNEGITFEDASERAKQAFFQILLTIMKKTLNRNSPSEERKFSIREIVKRIPGAKSLYTTFTVTILGRKEELQLLRLLNSSSPYHKDFMPLYEVITSSEKAIEKKLFG